MNDLTRAHFKSFVSGLRHRKMKMKFLFFLILVFPAYSELHAQAGLDSSFSYLFEPELNFHAGKLIKIHGEYPENSISTITEFYCAFKSRGKENWQAQHRYPTIGASFVYATFGNEEIIGHGFGVVPHVRKEWNKKNCIFGIRAGIGLAWFNRPFDPLDNPTNLVIGTRITAMASAWAGVMIPISPKLRYNLGVSMTHCSDGHLGVPNVGSNVIALSTGLAYTPFAILRTKVKPELNHEPKQALNWKPALDLLAGFHEFQGTTRPVGGPVYPVYGISTYLYKQLHEKAGISIGLNTYYYTAFRDYIISQELFPTSEADARSLCVVMFGGYEWHYGRFSLFVQAGVNVYAPFYHRFAEIWDLPRKGLINEWTAQKIGYKFYFLRKKIHMAGAIKTNGGTADFVETAIGINF